VVRPLHYDQLGVRQLPLEPVGAGHRGEVVLLAPDEQGRDAQWRPCHLDAERLRDVAGWVEGYRELWERRLDRLDAFLREMQAQEGTDDRDTP